MFINNYLIKSSIKLINILDFLVFNFNFKYILEKKYFKFKK